MELIESRQQELSLLLKLLDSRKKRLDSHPANLYGRPPNDRPHPLVLVVALGVVLHLQVCQTDGDDPGGAVHGARGERAAGVERERHLDKERKRSEQTSKGFFSLGFHLVFDSEDVFRALPEFLDGLQSLGCLGNKRYNDHHPRQQEILRGRHRVDLCFNPSLLFLCSNCPDLSSGSTVEPVNAVVDRGEVRDRRRRRGSFQEVRPLTTALTFAVCTV